MHANARNLLFGAVAAAALLGASGLAEAGSAKLHTMTVRMPDGEKAIVEYTGDIPPKVTFERSPWFAAFGGFPDFSAFERIQAQMDRQMQAAMREADSMARDFQGGDRLFDADFGDMAKGARGYSFFSSVSSNGACVKSVTVTNRGDGKRPRVERHVSGDCGKSAGADTDKGI
jgi:hypothetical protein